MPGARDREFGRIGGWLFNQPYLLLPLTSLFWSGNVVIGRFLAGHIPPVTLSFIRWGGATVILLPFAAGPLKRDWPAIRKHFGVLTLLAFTGFSAYNTIAYYGLQFTTAINGLILQSTGPLFVALWAFLLFGDRLSARQAVGTGAALGGVLIIICRGSLAVLLGVGFNPGDLCFVIALCIYAIYAPLLRKRPDIHPLSFLAVGMGWGALLLVPAMAVEIATGHYMVFDAVSFFSLTYVCIFPSLLGYLFLNRGIELIGANRSAPFLYLVPVFGSVLAIVFLGERFELYHAVGYALVLTGVMLGTRK